MLNGLLSFGNKSWKRILASVFAKVVCKLLDEEKLF